MKAISKPSRVYCNLALTLLCLTAPVLLAQGTPVHTEAAHPEQHLRSHLFVYDLRSGTSHEVFAADTIWEAPNWSPDGSYLISNSGGAIYKLVLTPGGKTRPPQKLAIPSDHRCNNDKAISPDGTMLAFSANVPPQRGSQVFLSNADGTGVKLMAAESPSYFHGWSPDDRTLAFVAQRNGSGQYDIYSMPVSGGPEKRLTENVHQDDGPDYSPDGKWIYINSDRSGKEAIWRFPSAGAGPNDDKAQMVVSDGLEDWFPHPSPDGKKLVYIGYPAGTPTHNPRDVHIEIKLVAVDHDKVAGATQKVLVQGTGGQGTFNVSSWSPDSTRFAYVLYEALP
jgi:TolB protein